MTLKLPPGTANGRTFRVRGRARREARRNQGDLLVTVEVAVPHELTAGREAARGPRDATTATTRGQGCWPRGGGA